MKQRLENYINLRNKKYRLMADISRLERMREEYSPTILNSGTGTRGSGVSSPTENIALNNLTFYAETEKEIAEKQKELDKVTAELNRLDRYIEAIPDEQLRETFLLRFTQGLSWANIAIKWYYAPASWERIQKKVYDYINQHELR